MTKKMSTIGILKNNGQFSIEQQTMPIPTGHDLLVKINAIAINPVDTKVRASLTEALAEARILGWDAMGIVQAVGEDTSLFKAGDAVFYAGDISRPGCYASHQLVDERIVGKAPKSLSAEQAAVMPLTSITAWEALFSRLKINPEKDHNKTVLIIGGAGGVGSIAIQLAKSVAKLNVVATASQEKSQAWCKQLGADHIINHRYDLVSQYQQLAIEKPDYILCLSHTDDYFDAMSQLIAPEGMICSIVETKKEHQLDTLKSKSAGFVWEFMFTRPVMKTPTMQEQHHLLNRIADLLDQGVIVTTLTEQLGAISPENIQRAHEQILKGRTIGKMALSSFG
jgi:zinc-binding alcohol dehydrogenase family protein